MTKMYELNDAELDAVAAGAGAGAGAGGVVAAAVAAAIDTVSIDVLNNSLNNLDLNIEVIEGDIVVQNLANGNNVGIGVLVNALGGPAALGIGQRQ